MFQELTIIGNLGQDPEMRYTPDGQAVANLSVATNNKYKRSNGEVVNETTWFRVTAWGPIAEVVSKYLKKGRQVMVKGRLNPDKETGGPRVYQKSDGTSGASYEVTAQRVVFLGGAGSADQDFGEDSDSSESPF